MPMPWPRRLRPHAGSVGRFSFCAHIDATPPERCRVRRAHRRCSGHATAFRRATTSARYLKQKCRHSIHAHTEMPPRHREILLAKMHDEATPKRASSRAYFYRQRLAQPTSSPIMRYYTQILRRRKKRARAATERLRDSFNTNSLSTLHTYAT